MSSFGDITEVARIKRMRRKVRDLRRKKRKHAGFKGGLVEFMERDGMAAPTHFAPFVAELEEIPKKRKQLCLSAPPRHGKTTLLHYLVAWLLILFPHWRIAWVSYGAKFAEEQTAAIRAIYIRAGGALGKKQTEAVWTTRAGGLLRASGLEGPLTGRGFHLIICDDAHQNLQAALSRTICEKVVSGYIANVWSRKIPRIGFPIGTSHVVSHTRWVVPDLIGTLTTGESANSWDYHNFPAINAQGEALAPEFFTIEDLEFERAQQSEHVFSALFLGVPRPVGGAIFGQVVTFDRVETEGAWRYAIGVDIAFSARTQADYNAAVVMRRNVATGVVQVVEVIRERGTLADRVTARGDEPQWSEGFLRSLHALTQRYPGAPVSMYVAKNETLVVGLAARHDTYPVRIRAMLADKNKWLRAQRYADAWGSTDGRLQVLRTAPWSPEFMREHANFTGDPKAPGHDDQVDAATAAYDTLVPLVGGPRGRARGTGEGGVMDRLGGIVAA